MRSCAVAMLSKSPTSDACKTRLTPPLTRDTANALQAALIQDIWDHIAPGDPYDLWVAAPSSQSLSYFESFTHRLVVQQGRNMGDKMRHVAASLFARGYAKVLLMGSDMPLMTRHLLTTACEGLRRADCILGPALDGGYYLIGLTPDTPDVFRNVPWSTNQVLGRTLHSLHQAGASYALLARHRDVDTWDDVQYYANAAALHESIPHVAAWLRAHPTACS